ncbi:helix-turn-helix transcriptional regulator [Nonomuraea wenchangensis]
METKTGDWQRLSRFVKERREHLRLTQHDVSARGGPSVATVRNIESAAAEGYRGRTFSQLEDALGWTRGSVDAILHGGQPSLPAGNTDEPSPSKTLGDVLVERGLRRPDELLLSDQVVDPMVEQLLVSDAFDDEFKNQWLSSYSMMRRQIFEATEAQKKKPRDR